MQCIQIIKLLCVDNQTVIGLHILRDHLSFLCWSL